VPVESSSSSSPYIYNKLLEILLDNYDDILYFLADFSVLVYKQHGSKVINLNKHLL